MELNEVVSSTGYYDAELVDVIESGWEDEPSEVEQELSRTVARNILTSDWLDAVRRKAQFDALTGAADDLLGLPNPTRHATHTWLVARAARSAQ